jgi:chaperonin GroES
VRLSPLTTPAGEANDASPLHLIQLIDSGDTNMKIRPLSDRVIVKRMEEDVKTASGIVLASSAVEKPDTGEVVAVGNGKVNNDGKLQAMSVKVGDKVLFGKYSGQTFKLDGQEFLTMREDDIIGIVEA